MNENDSSLTIPQQPIEYPYDYDPSLIGIGGWLILVVIGRILSVIIGVYNFANTLVIFNQYNVSDFWSYAITCIEMLNGVGLSFVMLILIFKRNIVFRRLFVIQMSIAILDALLIGIYTSTYTTLISTIASTVVWTIYFYRSLRVKNTFIYDKMYPAPAPATDQH